MLWLRVASAVIGLPLLGLFVYIGGWPFRIIIAVLALLGLWEYFHIINTKHPDLSTPIAFVWVAGWLLFPPEWRNDGLPALLALIVLYSLSRMVLKQSPTLAGDAAFLILGVCYTGILFDYIPLTRELPGGRWLVWLIFIITWAGDTGAYFIGSKLGRHPLIPKISPHKTVEGAVGGLICSVLAAGLFGWISGSLSGLGAVYAGQFSLLGLITGCFAQIGDLAESALKRYGGIKDSGFIIPGHGGVLDRFDGILFAAPVVYYYLWWMLY